MSKLLVDAVNYVAPEATSSSQFNSSKEDLKNAVTQTGNLVYDTAALSYDTVLAGVKIGTHTILASQVPTTLFMLQVTTGAAATPTVLSSACAFTITNPWVAPAIGLGMGVLWAKDQLLDGAYRGANISVTAVKGLKNVATGIAQGAAGTVLALKESLETKDSLDTEEIELIAFGDEEDDALFGIELDKPTNESQEQALDNPDLLPAGEVATLDLATS
jgi:hypothetical protein